MGAAATTVPETRGTELAGPGQEQRRMGQQERAPAFSRAVGWYVPCAAPACLDQIAKLYTGIPTSLPSSSTVLSLLPRRGISSVPKVCAPVPSASKVFPPTLVPSGLPRTPWDCTPLLSLIQCHQSTGQSLESTCGFLEYLFTVLCQQSPCLPVSLPDATFTEEPDSREASESQPDWTGIASSAESSVWSS